MLLQQERPHRRHRPGPSRARAIRGRCWLVLAWYGTAPPAALRGPDRRGPRTAPGFEVTPFDVAAKRLELGAGRLHLDHRQVVVGGEGRDGATWPPVELAAGHGNPAPVGVADQRRGWPLAVAACPDGVGTIECLPSAPTTSCLGRWRPAFLVAADAHHAVVAKHDILDPVTLQDLGARRPGRIHKDRVQQRSSQVILRCQQA